MAGRGNPKGVGRPKGTPNKVTAEAKGAIELAFQGLGGVDALTEWAEGNKDGFYQNVWTKILPKNLDVTSGGKPLTADERTQRLDAILTVLEARARSR